MQIPKTSLILPLFFLANIIFSLELKINDRHFDLLNLSAMEDGIIATLANPDPMVDGLNALPISRIFPWMDSVEHIEIDSVDEYASWESSQNISKIWQNAKLVFNAGQWELRISDKTMQNPKMIAIRGDLMDIPVIRIWTSVPESDQLKTFKRQFEAVMALRHVHVLWEKIGFLDILMQDPPDNGLPHLILLSDLDMIRMQGEIATYGQIIDIAKMPGPPEDDLIHAETSLHWILAENPLIVNDQGEMPAVLTRLLDNGKAALDANRVNIIRSTYVAIPQKLDNMKSQIAALVLNEALMLYKNYGDVADAIPLPLTQQTLRYIEAYRRIGRLALSSQIQPEDATALITSFVKEQ